MKPLALSLDGRLRAGVLCSVLFGAAGGCDKQQSAWAPPPPPPPRPVESQLASPPVAPLAIVEFAVEPSAVDPGQEVRLTWSVAGASRVEIYGIGPVPLVGMRPMTAVSFKTFKLTAIGPEGVAVGIAVLRILPARP